MNKYCLVCTPRSGSFYVLKHLSETMNLENGKEWFGRMKKVHYDGLKTSPLTIDYTQEENLLTNKERSKRILHLKNNNNFIIKCMPLQLTNTVEDKHLPYNEKLNITYKMLKNFQLIWLKNRNKISQFCFKVIAEETSKEGYSGINKEFSEYNEKKRKIPKTNSFSAVKEDFDRFMFNEKFTNDLEKMFRDVSIIYYEDYISHENIKIIPNPDYSKIFTNYEEIKKWFQY